MMAGPACTCSNRLAPEPGGWVRSLTCPRSSGETCKDPFVQVEMEGDLWMLRCDRVTGHDGQHSVSITWGAV